MLLLLQRENKWASWAFILISIAASQVALLSQLWGRAKSTAPKMAFLNPHSWRTSLRVRDRLYLTHNVLVLPISTRSQARALCMTPMYRTASMNIFTTFRRCDREVMVGDIATFLLQLSNIDGGNSNEVYVESLPCWQVFRQTTRLAALRLSAFGVGSPSIIQLTQELTSFTCNEPHGICHTQTYACV